MIEDVDDRNQIKYSKYNPLFYLYALFYLHENKMLIFWMKLVMVNESTKISAEN